MEPRAWRRALRHEPHYVLLVDTRDRERHICAAATIEQRLRSNPQYDYARRIGQLAPVAYEMVDQLLERYLHLGTGTDAAWPTSSRRVYHRSCHGLKA